MEQYVKCVIFAFFTLTQAQQFRLDYKYNSEAKAFYKLHVEMNTKSYALEVCSMEGAQLMTVSSNVDVAQALSMLEQYPDLEVAWIGDDERSFKSEKVTPSGSDSDECKVVTNTWKVQPKECYYQRPFICKVNASDAYYDTKCQVFGKDYQYVAKTGSCYRIPKIALIWDHANDECKAQGAHLVIINSEAENQEVVRIFKKTPYLDNFNKNWWFFAGFRADEPDYGTSRVFKTVFNQTLEEAGYVNWERNEPNNANGVEDCGVVYTNTGEFNDVNCMQELLFICEKEITSVSS